MLQLSGGDSISIKECNSINNVWLDELDHVSLIQRRNLLLQRKSVSCSSEGGDSAGWKHAVIIHPSVGVKEEPVDCHLQFEVPISNDLCDFKHDLDHIVLKERQRMLISRKKGSMIGLPMEVPPTNDGNLADTVIMKDELEISTENINMDKSENSEASQKEKINSPRKRKKTATETLDEDAPGLLQLLPTNDGNFAGTVNMKDELKISTENINIDKSENSEASQKEKINNARKRKKTAMASVREALDEDAPGLLQMLVEKGVSVEEIRLYGETNSDECIDPSFIEYGFAELEAVISKLYFQRTALLKFSPMRCLNNSRPRYCLACLFSLIQQIQYLHIRNWPAQWGWCRDLHAFIFVFERHNRLVLERPVYGYATYFFELVNFVPVDWQILRLATAMKLTNCGRVTLTENRPLLVGEDISEGEAEVLMQFGWIPNSGVGTMLGYCDRVVHDRQTVRDSLEWRSKIGKLLAAGFNGGSVVSSDAKKNIIDYVNCRSLEKYY